MNCLCCYSFLAKDNFCLCDLCYKKITFFPYRKNSPLYTIFYYSTITRALILEAKIKGNHRVFLYLKKILLAKINTISFLQDCDAIMPAASSLWSRVFGRFDLAWLLSYELAKYLDKPLITCDSKLYFNWKKSTFSKTRDFSNLYLRTKAKGKKILIFDDVITTGETIQRVHDSLTEDVSVKILCLAASRFVVVKEKSIRCLK